MSLWLKTCELPKYESLDKDITCDVLIMGGGLAGLLTAFLLKEKGVDAVVIESKEIANGTTGYTTGKITSQHGLCYHNLQTQLGSVKAEQYAKANENAIRHFKHLIDKHGIDCDFEYKPAYVYTTNTKYIEDIKKEAQVAKEFGIDSEFVLNGASLNLPFPIDCAIKYNNQAQFHPVKFISHIAKDLKIYEHTKAIDVNTEEMIVKTTKSTINVKYIIFATHYPFNYTPGYYFLRMHQNRSYLLALKPQQNSKIPDGMSIDVNTDNGYTFRTYNGYILFGGKSHRTGENTGGKYEELEYAAKEFYPKCNIEYKWSAQDCISLDDIPYIGQFSSQTPNIYVATGFRKWGMTGSMVAANIITDMIVKNDSANFKNEIPSSDYREVYSPQRFNLSASAATLFKDASKALKGLAKEKLTIPDDTLNDIKNNEGKVIEYQGEKVGVYKDKDGTIYTVSAKCTHLGCQLEWNPDELSWDCPCHGSRFDYKGFILDNPAVEPASYHDKEG